MPILVLLLVAGVLEISVLVTIGQHLGVLPTIGLLILGGVVGIWLLRREGRRTLQEFSEAARLRRPPTRELADGVLIAAGGVLIILPGVISDVLGLLCLFPPTRALVRKRVERSAERRSREAHDRMRVQAEYLHRQQRTDGPGDVIDGEVVSVDDDGEETDDPGQHPLPGTSTQAEDARDRWDR
ncbi:FxsA family protein [Parasphingorhabdus pacifica]